MAMKIVRKIIVPLMITIIFVCSFSNVFAAESICVLSDFENGLEGWNNDFESTMYRTNKEAHTGSFSLETTVMNDYGCPKFHFRFIPGVRYRFSVWVKVQGASDVAQVIFDYSAYGQQQPYWGFFGVNTPVSQDGWTEIAFDYVYNGGNPTGDTNIFVRIGDGRVKDLASEERKTYYIDDMKISYQNPNYNFVDTKLSAAETAVNPGFDLNTDGYYTKNARMRYVKEGCNNTYGAALVMTDAADGYVGQKYTAEEGKRYELSAYIRSPEKKLPFRYMVAEKADGKYFSRPLSTDVIVGKEWTKLTAAYELRDDGFSNEKIFYISGGNGGEEIKYYLDEFSILKYDSAQESEYREKNKYFSNPGGRLVLNNGRDNLTGDAEPYFQNSEFMCQADLLAYAIGAESGYLPDGSFYLKKGLNTLRVVPYSNAAYYNKLLKIQQNAPVYVNEKLMMSADFAAEMFGLETEFLAEHNIYCINNDGLNGYLSNTVRKIEKNEKLKIAYFGASFTRGGDTDYPLVAPLKQRIANWFQENYPGLETELIDAEVSGTDSTLGAYRLENDVLVYQPDLVFIDFSINDFDLQDPGRTAQNLENIVRRITEYKKETDIVILNSLSSSMLGVYDAGEQPFITKIERDIASYYDAAFLDLSNMLYEDYKQSGAAFTSYMIKDMQLTEKSAALYMAAIADFFTDCLHNNHNLYEKKRPAPMFAQNSQYRIIHVEEAAYTDGWTIKNEKISGAKNAAAIYADTAGSELRVDFQGTAVGLMWQVSPRSGAIEYQIDGGSWSYLDAYDDLAYQYSRLSYVILGEDLENTQHTLKIRVAGKVDPRSMGSEIVIGGFLEKRDGQ